MPFISSALNGGLHDEYVVQYQRPEVKVRIKFWRGSRRHCGIGIQD